MKLPFCLGTVVAGASWERGQGAAWRLIGAVGSGGDGGAGGRWHEKAVCGDRSFF